MIEHFSTRMHMLAQSDPADSAESGRSLLEHISSGGPIGFVIIGLSFLAFALIIASLVSIRMKSLAPDAFVDQLRDLLTKGNVKGAVQLCRDPDRSCFLGRIYGAALIRCSRSPFGLLELRTALEEAGAEQVDRLHRSTDGVGLIASVAPMLGLLGTVVGLVGAFETIGRTEGFAKPDQLAGDISQALITTVLGLIVAIPCTAAYTYLKNRVDALSARVGELSEEIAALIEAPNRPGPKPTAPQTPPRGTTPGQATPRTVSG